MEQNNSTRRVISLLVDNSNGVLARISSLFCRRGFNIDSLTVSATNDPCCQPHHRHTARHRTGAEPADPSDRAP